MQTRQPPPGPACCPFITDFTSFRAMSISCRFRHYGCLLSALLLLALLQAPEAGAATADNSQRENRRFTRAAVSNPIQDGRHHRQQQQQQQAVNELPADALRRQSASISCSADVASKRTCLFNNVCLVPTPGSNSNLPPSLTVVSPFFAASSSSSSNSAASRNAVALLKQALAGQKRYQGTTYLTSQPAEDHPSTAAHLSINSSISSNEVQSAISAILANGINADSSIHVDHGVTVLWRSDHRNQNSFGHALVNEVYPLFLVLSNHFGVGPSDLPRQLQLLVPADGWQSHVLPHLLADTITGNMHLLSDKMELLQQQGKLGVCFRHLLVGDGGYTSASRASLANSGKPEAATYAAGPSFFNSKNWLAFRAHSMQVAGVLEGSYTNRPLVLLNDKRYHDSSSDRSPGTLKIDRRMILDIEHLADDIRAAYPTADVVPVRFRDLSWPDQLTMLSQAKVFITTQGSSGFRWVWLPPGSTCVVIGAPEPAGDTEWKSFHELDRWFPLSYVAFERYPVNVNDSSEYNASVMPGHWQPKDPDAAKRWWLYNADVRVDFERLRPMINQALT